MITFAVYAAAVTTNVLVGWTTTKIALALHRGRTRPPSNAWFLKPLIASPPNGISIGLAIVAQYLHCNKRTRHVRQWATSYAPSECTRYYTRISCVNNISAKDRPAPSD